MGEKEEKLKMKTELMKEVEEEMSQKYRLKKKKTTDNMRFKEKEQKKDVTTTKDANITPTKVNEEENTEDDNSDDTSQLKKLVMDLTNQVKSLKIQNEHMMDDD